MSEAAEQYVDVLATSHLPEEKQVPIETQEAEDSPDILETNFETTEPENDAEIETDNQSPPENKAEDLVTAPSDTESSSNSVDDYGNEKPVSESKTYTEDEVNDRINQAVRERLARMEKNNPQAAQPQQQPSVPTTGEVEASGDWQGELKDFIKQTNSELQTETMQHQQQAQEQAAQQEFESKLMTGASKFNDFRDVVGSQPITDAMTIATRGMKDPASFLYAASKRQGKELERISKIPDMYTQMVEIGRLEERMKKQQSGTKASRPMSRTREDATVMEPEKRKETIEDLMHASSERRMAQFRRRTR